MSTTHLVFFFLGGASASEAPPQPEVTPSAAAGSSRRRRDWYAARYRGQLYEFETLAELEDFVEESQAKEKAKPARIRKPVRISLAPEAVEYFAPVASDDAPLARFDTLPINRAMEQLRTLEARKRNIAEDEEDDWLISILLT